MTDVVILVAAVAAQAKQTMASLRAMEHTDISGNVISKSPKWVVGL